MQLLLKLKSSKLAKYIAGGMIGLLSVFIISALSLKELRITKTAPENNAYHNPFEPIALTFNRKVDQKTIGLAINPEVKITISQGQKNNILLVTPQQKFLPETNYQLTVELSHPFVLNFITDTEAGKASGWNEEFNRQSEQYFAEHGVQDEALRKIRRSAPIQYDGFSIKYDYSNNTYTISLTPPYAQTKAQALKWLNSEGVTDLRTVRIEWVQQ